jgi:pyruvate/2-oxoglutarate/acetoin dehydrogenase E1 component
MTYADELARAMQIVAERPNAIFLGQGVADHGGTTMSPTFKGVPASQRLEMPVAEELQMGMAIGMALEGLLPVCVFPRWNFMLRAADQLVNHLDRLPLYSDGGYRPRVLIRVAVPSTDPFNPGPQHDDDFSEAFDRMLRTVHVARLTTPAVIVPEYLMALNAAHSTILVEYTAFYKRPLNAA